MSIEDQLGRHAREALEEPVPDEPHIDDETLALVADGRAKLKRAQRSHLSRCHECRDVLGVTVALTRDEPAPRTWRWSWALVPAIAAAAALVLFVRADPNDVAYQPRGVTAPDAASVTFLATDAEGRARDLLPGAQLRVGERIGFRYGNPRGARSTLTVLGWDGDRVHWYYPDAPDKAAHAIEEDALSERLPFDFTVDAPGALRLVAAFDVEPGALAAQLRSGGEVDAAELEVRVVE